MIKEHPERMACNSGRQRRPLRGHLGGVLVVAVLAGLCQRSAAFPLRSPGQSSRSRSTWHLIRWGLHSYPRVVGRPAGAATFLHTIATDDNDGADAFATNQTLRLLLVDHYDSFTYNLVDLLAQLGGAPPEVVAWDALSRREGEGSQITDGYDGIILSPGPGAPDDYPASLRLVEAAIAAGVPLLGVCLGHQMVGLAHGATVCRAPEPVHGRVWECRVVEDAEDMAATTSELNDTYTPKYEAVFLSRLFRGIPRRFHATRYHSLQVVVPSTTSEQTPTLRVTATTAASHCDRNSSRGDNSVIMALESTVAPQFGVQFHPESVGSLAVGRALLRNFLQICRDHRSRWRGRTLEMLQEADKPVMNSSNAPKPSTAMNGGTGPSGTTLINRKLQKDTERNETVVYVSRLDNASVHWTPRQVMGQLYGKEPFAYWLDNAIAPQAVSSPPAQIGNSAPLEDAVSVLGASQERVEYWLESERSELYKNSDQKALMNRRIIEYNGNDSQKVTFGQDIFEYLANEYPVHSRTNSVTFVDWDPLAGDEPVLSVLLEKKHPLPFGFRGGHIGYLGYECRFDTLRYIKEAEGFLGQNLTEEMIRKAPDPNVPTAAFLLARQSCVFHHATGTWYLLGVGRNQKEKMDALEWMKQTKNLLTSTTYADEQIMTDPIVRNIPLPGLNFVPNRSRSIYMRNFEKCIEFISSGESYELCLTNQLEALLPGRDGSALELYEILRLRNPAPHAAYLHWNLQQSFNRTSGSFAICCSSPERFVSVKRTTNEELVAETKPIKGTRARVLPLIDGQRSLEEEQADSQRAKDLQASIKDRAENLMIVDLLRNDFSRVCKVGSVHVSKMMAIESYATVHQMVTTIRGQLDPNTSTAIDLLKACFPGGSMTGAPKIRTMELLNNLEEGVARGPYSGCLGYISLNGCADMNIIIRTAVLTPHERQGLKVSIGSGGAITALSADFDEYNEMLLKAFPVTEAVSEWTVSKRKGAAPLIRSYNFTSN